ncbi:rod shape-determining protein MreD [Roseomonas sp. NAR14]|uniref:Rod shape-determining protein MreD n=1 Tax=Roseomonas acroporae TaxID=2937791 RepID=A0A9X1Y992_9PROT|nr:rod shape-determining protein MreD [Roseomonas acroporae]MCK8786484.1 rod shape-determining protein MreD [Roseomonas acroporae]
MSVHGKPEPAPGLLRRLDATARATFPVAFTALLMVLAAAPVGPPGLVWAVALPCVFFWSLFRPAYMPPLAVFPLGLLHDLLSFGPLGIGVLILLITHGLAMRWRRALVRRSFLVVWLAYCGFALGAGGLGWVLQAVLGWRVPPIAPGLNAVGMSAGLYPSLAWLLGRAHLAMLHAESAA